MIGSTTCPAQGASYGVSLVAYLTASTISAAKAVAKPAFKALMLFFLLELH